MRLFVIIAGAFIAGMITMYAALSGSSSGTLPSGLSSVPTYTISVVAVAQDKPTLRKHKAISKKVANDPSKEVLATGVVKDDSGKRTVSAVIDTPSGVTHLAVERPWAEFMLRQEASIGYGFVDGDMAREIQYRMTFARIWNFYGTLQVDAFQVERDTHKTPWNAMALLSYRW